MTICRLFSVNAVQDCYVIISIVMTFMGFTCKPRQFFLVFNLLIQTNNAMIIWC